MKDLKDQLQIDQQDRERLKREVTALSERLGNIPWIKALNLSAEQIERNVILLDDAEKSAQIALHPHAIEDCLQRFKGRQVKITVSDTGVLHRTFVECSCVAAWKRENSYRSKYLVRHFSDDLLTVSFPPEINNNVSRAKIVRNMEDALANNKTRGLYICGEPGIGKTHIAVAFANAFAKQGKTVAFVLVPRLVNEIRSTFKDATSNPHDDLLAALRDADLLVLDDIGGEQVLPWFRDERLFPVLDFRMQEKKLTFFTSNLAYDELFAVYAKEERIRAIRLMDRIKALSAFAPMTGSNLRY